MTEKKSTKASAKRPSSRTRAHAESGSKAKSTSRTRRGTATTRTASTTPAATTDVRKVAPEDADDPRALPRPSGPPSVVEQDEARRMEADRNVAAGLPVNTAHPDRPTPTNLPG